MPQTCKACVHPERRQLDLDLTSNQTPITVLAERYGIDGMTLRRHKASHFKPLLPVVMRGHTDPVTLLSELDVVKEAAARFMNTAENDGHLGLAIAALRERRQTIEMQIKVAADLGVLVPNSARMNKAVAAILKALEPYEDARDTVLRALQEVIG